MLSEKAFPLMRSKLFVPAIRPELFTKALVSDADVVCFDLEEGVTTERKTEARKLLSEFICGLDAPVRPVLMVRVNSVASADLLLDLEAAVHHSIFAIALPKVEESSDIHFVDGVLSKLERERGITEPLGILATIESPRGLRLAANLATCSPRIIGLQLGFADLLEPIGISSTDNRARNQIRLLMKLAAAEGNVDCFESAYPQFTDEAGFLAQLQDAHAIGFAGASCIHPKQIAAANHVFTPTARDIEEATAIVQAFEEAARKGSAIAQFQGKMIDRPFFLRAQKILSHHSSK